MNRHILAATLRAQATRLERAAWELEQLAVRNAMQQGPLRPLVNQQRAIVKSLRRAADKIAPRRVKVRRSEPKAPYGQEPGSSDLGT